MGDAQKTKETGKSLRKSIVIETNGRERERERERKERVGTSSCDLTRSAGNSFQKAALWM